MNYKQDNSKIECDHYCHSCTHNITEEKDGLYYHKCRLKTKTETKNSEIGGHDMKCDKCGIENNTVRPVVINERDINICSDCIKKIGDIHSIGSRSVSDHISDAVIEKTYIYLKTLHPEYFGNADRIKIGYRQECKNMSRKEWELIAKLDVVASVMNFERDQYGDYRRFIINCLNDESSEYHKNARMYFDALVPVSKEEFEKMALKEVWSK